MSFLRGAILSLFMAIAANGQNYVRVESGGQSYVIDADSEAVQKNLKPANPQAGAIKFPAWLKPHQGAVPKLANYDARTGISEAYFDSGGTVDQVMQYYTELFRSNGFTSGAPMGRVSKIVSGKNASGTVSVIASMVRGVVEIHVTFAPSAATSGKKHFKAAWYDDTRGLLCLEDTSTGEQYYLDKRIILEANLNRPGGVKSEGTFITASLYQLQTVRIGARATTPLEDFSAQIVAELGDDKVDIRIGKTFRPMTIGVPQTPKDQIAVGIRYSVPKR